MKISEISVTEVTAAYPGPQFPPGDRQARQIDVYPEHNATSHINLPAPGETDIGAVRWRLRRTRASTGLYGPIEEVQAFLILRQLRPLSVGTGRAGDRAAV